MSWISKYRFTLTHPVVGSRVVTPLISDFQVEYSRDDEWGFYRKDSPTELLFAQDDYDWIIAIEQGADRCEKIDLLVEVNSGSSFVTYHEGYISLTDATFDTDNCRVTLTARSTDDYTCLFENWETEYDVLGPFATVEVQGLLGVLEFETCVGSIPAPGINLPPIGNLADPANTAQGCLTNPADGWTLYTNTLIITNTTDPQPGPFYGTLSTVWVREKFVDPSLPYTAPAGSGWIQIAPDTWVRSVPVVFDAANSVINESVDGLETLTAEIQYIIPGQEDYDNGMPLANVLQVLAGTACGLTVKSKFFRINDTAPPPSTAPYVAAVAGFDEIIVWQKSDIIRPSVSGNATVLITTLKEMIEQLKAVFNISFRVEDSGATLRIEHVSYFEGVNGLDATTSTYATYIDRRNEYSYLNIKVPLRERFEWMDDSSAFFTGEDIIYPASCAGEDQRIEIIQATRVTTDIAAIRADEERFTLQGMVFGAVYNTSGIRYWNLDSGYVNGHLAYTNLHENYWRHDRPLIEGNMNGVDTIFSSAERIKQQEQLSIKIPLSVFLTLNPDNYIKTGLGWGEIVTAVYSAKNCQFETQLTHEQ